MIVYFVITTALLFALRKLHYMGLLRQQQGYYAKYKTAFLEENNFDVLFLGSSRAEMHYDTQLFDSLTHKNSFNLSLAGASTRVAFAALKTYLSKSKTPGYLVYEVDYQNLKYRPNELMEFNNFFPFLSDKTFREEFNAIDPRMNHFYYDPYYSLPFTGLKNLSTSLHGWLNIPNNTDAFFYKGFYKELSRPALDYVAEKAGYAFFDVTARRYLDSIITLCKQRSIKLALVTSPIFGGGKATVINKAQIVKQVQDIAKINGIYYFDLSLLPFCNNRKLFIDHYHLDYAGAQKFTGYFAQVFNNKIGVTALK